MSRPRHQDTIAIAEAALEQITARNQPADPRSYALWYKFATGNSGLLCAAVNSRLARGGTLDAKDIDELHSAHISPTDASAKVNRLGARVAGEIEQVKAMIEAAEGSASHYSANLTDVSRRLGTVQDRDGVRAIVERLVLATKQMETSNGKLQDQLQVMWEVVRTESLTDALTSLGNRKFFDAALERSVAECHADNEPLSLLLADVDHFKQINDTFGHVVGDRVLRFVASTLKDTITGKDIAARYGGKEFAVIMPRTPLRAAVDVAEQLRLAVKKAELVRRSTGEKQSCLTISIGVAALHARTSPQAMIEAADVRRAVMTKELMKSSTGEHLGRVTISVGVAALQPHDSAQSLIERADNCLYAAKRSGRNCVIGERDERLLTAVAG